MARDYKGIGNQEQTAVAVPVITPDRAEKRQNGRRFKENGDPAFTLTAQDKHGVAIGIDDLYKTRNARVFENEMPTLRSERNGLKCGYEVEILNVDEDGTEYPGMYVKFQNGTVGYATWYEKEQCYIVIRKLTPRECFRLQGWTDDYFDKAAFVNSDSQLYKQAGNGVTVQCVQAIGEKL